MPSQGTITAHVEENTSSHSANENINEEDVILVHERSGVVLTTSYSYHTSIIIYESPVMPILSGPPKFSV